jgi:hypothetical protein
MTEISDVSPSAKLSYSDNVEYTSCSARGINAASSGAHSESMVLVITAQSNVGLLARIDVRHKKSGQEII